MVKITQLFSETTDASYVLVKLLNRNFIVNKNNPSQRLLIEDSKKSYDCVYKSAGKDCFAYCEDNVLFLLEGVSSYLVFVISSTHKIFVLLSENILYFYEIYTPFNFTGKNVNFIGSVNVKHVYYLFSTSFDKDFDIANATITKLASKVMSRMIKKYSDNFYYIHPKYIDFTINELSKYSEESVVLFWIRTSEGYASSFITYTLPVHTSVKVYCKSPFYFYKIPNALINMNDGFSCDISVLEEYAQSNEEFKKVFDDVYNYKFAYSANGLTLILKMDKDTDDTSKTTEVILFDLVNKKNMYSDKSTDSSIPIIRTCLKESSYLPNIFLEEIDGQMVYKIYYYVTHVDEPKVVTSDENPIVIKNPRKGIEFIFVKANNWDKSSEKTDILLVLTSTHILIKEYKNCSFENFSKTGNDFDSNLKIDEKRFFSLDDEGFFIAKFTKASSNTYLFVSASNGSEIDYIFRYDTYQPCLENEQLLFIVTHKNEVLQDSEYFFNPRTFFTTSFEQKFNELIKKSISEEDYIEL